MALAIAVELGDTSGPAAQIAQGAVAGTTARAVIGTLQWLVPRTRFSAARWWVAASVGGWATGAAAGHGAASSSAAWTL